MNEEIEQLRAFIEQHAATEEQKRALLETVNIFSKWDAHRTNIRFELLTPLNAILGYCYLLLSLKDGELNEDQKEHVKQIEESVLRLAKMIRDIFSEGFRF